MYLLAFKNNEEREELYNGAVGREFSILVRNFSLTRPRGIGEGKKGEEKKCQTHKNKTKQKVCVLHACFWCVLQNTLLRTFSLNFFLVLQLSSLSLSTYITSSIKLQSLFLRASHERSQRPFDVGVVLIDRP